MSVCPRRVSVVRPGVPKIAASRATCLRETGGTALDARQSDWVTCDRIKKTGLCIKVVEVESTHFVLLRVFRAIRGSFFCCVKSYPLIARNTRNTRNKPKGSL